MHRPTRRIAQFSYFFSEGLENKSQYSDRKIEEKGDKRMKTTQVDRLSST